MSLLRQFRFLSKLDYSNGQKRPSCLYAATRKGVLFLKNIQTGRSSRFTVGKRTYILYKSIQLVPNVHRCERQLRLASRLAYYEFGVPSEVVKYESFEEPTIQKTEADQVIVRMLAAPIHPSHINTIQGTYPLRPKSFPAVGGAEGIGKVIAVGGSVKELKIGDLVYPGQLTTGTWATHIKEKESSFDKVTLKSQIKFEQEFKKGDGINFIAALSVLRINPGTALRMLNDFVPDMTKGDIIIQNGANSAVGQAVIQLAKEMDLVTVNIIRDRENVEELKEDLKRIGADYVWTESELRSAKEFRDNIIPKAKLALNCVGGSSSTEISKCLGSRGVHVTYGGMSLKPVTAATSALIFKDISFKGFWMSRWASEHAGTSELKDMYNHLESLLLSGKLSLPKHKMISFDDQSAVCNALSQAIKGKTGGKFILDMRST